MIDDGGQPADHQVYVGHALRPSSGCVPLGDLKDALRDR
jgi:hypothetical protein